MDSLWLVLLSSQVFAQPRLCKPYEVAVFRRVRMSWWALASRLVYLTEDLRALRLAAYGGVQADSAARHHNCPACKGASRDATNAFVAQHGCTDTALLSRPSRF